MQKPTLVKTRAMKSGPKNNSNGPAAGARTLNSAATDSTGSRSHSLPFAHKRWFVANPRVQDSALND
jgi:hypothetical protein